jgi:hypothetical protein
MRRISTARLSTRWSKKNWMRHKAEREESLSTLNCHVNQTTQQTLAGAVAVESRKEEGKKRRKDTGVMPTT